MEARHLTSVHLSVSLISWSTSAAFSNRLLVPLQSCLYSRAFLVAAAQVSSSLRDDIVLTDSLSTFRRQLKHYLFQQFFCTVTAAQL